MPNSSPSERPLELSPSQFRALVEAATARIGKYIEALPRMSSAPPSEGAALAREIRQGMPEHGAPLEPLLDLLFDRVIPSSFCTPGPGYLAYIPGGGILATAVADLIADATNRYVGVWAAAPGLAQIEADVVAWLAGIVGYPPAARGVLTSGGSISNFSAIVTARREKLPPDFLSGSIYGSDQTHHSVEKAAMLAGFPPGSVRSIPTDAKLRIRVDLLAERIAADRAAGAVPFLVVGNAGTTNTGAVDDLPALADLARREGLWFHVDAAYGGFFALTEEGRAILAGIERSDSVILDPHKGLFLPYGTGCLLVRDGGALKRAHALTADYLPEMQEEEEFVDFCQISPELSRSWRGIRVWLPVRLHGIAPFRENLREKLALARLAADALRAMPEIEILAEPQLSIVAFRRAWPGRPSDEVNEANRRLLEAVNARGRVHLTGTMLGGDFAIRICVLSFRTHRDRIEMALEDIRRAIQE
ncbi:MAG TPA: pyridoxal-dependent decarboxylase [Thermoanaerobaculia bacterium]|nr:pyridoxal-dependent decarboxylase [Thermoanaerobaculia bacterium]